jgi:hypothetical protein
MTDRLEMLYPNGLYEFDTIDIVRATIDSTRDEAERNGWTRIVAAMQEAMAAIDSADYRHRASSN